MFSWFWSDCPICWGEVECIIEYTRNVMCKDHALLMGKTKCACTCVFVVGFIHVFMVQHGSTWSGVVTRGLGNVSSFIVGMVKVSSLER